MLHAGNETFERLAVFGLFANFMVYMTRELHLDQVYASNIFNIWFGMANFAPLIGAFISDAYVGRFRTIAFASFGSLLVRSYISIYPPASYPLNKFGLIALLIPQVLRYVLIAWFWYLRYYDCVILVSHVLIAWFWSLGYHNCAILVSNIPIVIIKFLAMRHTCGTDLILSQVTCVSCRFLVLKTTQWQETWL